MPFLWTCTATKYEQLQLFQARDKGQLRLPTCQHSYSGHDDKTHLFANHPFQQETGQIIHCAFKGSNRVPCDEVLIGEMCELSHSLANITRQIEYRPKRGVGVGMAPIEVSYPGRKRQDSLDRALTRRKRHQPVTNRMRDTDVRVGEYSQRFEQVLLLKKVQSSLPQLVSINEPLQLEGPRQKKGFCVPLSVILPLVREGEPLQIDHEREGFGQKKRQQLRRGFCLFRPQVGLSLNQRLERLLIVQGSGGKADRGIRVDQRSELRTGYETWKEFEL